jgi:CheY-like chemotaxis protein
MEAAARNPPDLILPDINMPEMSGFQVCEMLNAFSPSQVSPPRANGPRPSFQE